MTNKSEICKYCGQKKASRNGYNDACAYGVFGVIGAFTGIICFQFFTFLLQKIVA